MRKPKILITAGATHEHIDPVRYITNASSGLQGKLLAYEAIKRGYEVIFIAGRLTIPIDDAEPNLKIINVVSADDMYEAAMKHFPKCDVAICAAAVGDYKVKNQSTEKIKRTGDSITIELAPNKDIAKSLGEIKKTSQILIGFALETNEPTRNAWAKIVKKNLDYVVLNQVTKDNPAFNVNNNVVTIIKNDGTIVDLEKSSKEVIATKIFDICL